MRRVTLVSVLVVFSCASLAASAYAFDHHFTVLSKAKTAHRAGNIARFTDKLLDPRTRDRVGRDRARCKLKPHRQEKCHAVIHLNGKIGGFGDIKVVGDLERGDNRLNVVGGTDEFNGVAGKMLLHLVTRKLQRFHFDLTR